MLPAVAAAMTGIEAFNTVGVSARVEANALGAVKATASDARSIRFIKHAPKTLFHERKALNLLRASRLYRAPDSRRARDRR